MEKQWTSEKDKETLGSAVVTEKVQVQPRDDDDLRLRAAARCVALALVKSVEGERGHPRVIGGPLQTHFHAGLPRVSVEESAAQLRHRAE